MQATIEIDLGPLASEWEVVAVRLPKAREFFVNGCEVDEAVFDFPDEPQIIVRRKWVFPSWLKARWYCEDSDGVQRCCKRIKPETGVESWYSTDICRVDPTLVDIPKIGGDWKQSLRENPNWRPDNGQKDT